MAYLKWGITAAIFALFFSVFMGFISDVNIFHIILRGFIFSAVFFGLGFGLRFMINNFFPEMLYKDDDQVSQEYDQAGSRIDIVVDSSGEYAVPELYKSESQELGNIEDLISGVFKTKSDDDGIKHPYGASGIDALREAGYNNAGLAEDEFQDFSVFEKPIAEKPAAFKPQFTPSFGDDSGLGSLPDLDMMARAFSSVSESAPAPKSAAPAAVLPMAPMFQPEEIEPIRSQYTGNKPKTLDGDFDPRSLAEGIRTVLSKD
ncbi:MAG: hypothetical protein FWD40_11460 [Treponema sp.]|nr:hypothetical protein [Treponema sp.]